MRNNHAILLSIILTVSVLTISLPQDAEATHPRKITNLTGTVDDREVNLSWDTPQKGNAPQDYIIQYKQTSSSSWITITDSVSTRTNITITGFTNGVSYDFRVTGETLGNSLHRYSDPITLIPQSSTTIQTVDPPTNLQAYPKDESMILEWNAPKNTPVSDYVIQYKRNYENEYTPFTGNVNTDTTVKITGLDNEREYHFKVASKAGNIISDFTDVKIATPTEKCSELGADNIAKRCYATQSLIIDPNTKKSSKQNVNGIKGTINFEDNDIQSGINQASYWLTFRDNAFTKTSIIMEVGIHGNSEGLKFVCAVDGKIKYHNWNTTPRNNTNYNFQIEESGNDWIFTVNGENCYTYEDVPINFYPQVFKRGTETSRNNHPDFTQEFDNMKMKWSNGIWYYVQEFFGDDSPDYLEREYFIDLCGRSGGSVSENFYHIETGKGETRNC